MKRCFAILTICLALVLTQESVLSGATSEKRHQQGSRPTSAPSWFSDQAIRRHKSQRSVILGSQMQQNAILSTHSRQKTKETPKKEERSSSPGELQFSYDNEKRNWSARPLNQGPSGSDEGLGLHEEHRLRAFTRLDDDQDLDISAGPELILKDQKHSSTVNSSKQPDSELGVGMRFTYGF